MSKKILFIQSAVWSILEDGDLGVCLFCSDKIDTSERVEVYCSFKVAGRIVRCGEINKPKINLSLNWSYGFFALVEMDEAGNVVNEKTKVFNLEELLTYVDPE